MGRCFPRPGIRLWNQCGTTLHVSMFLLAHAALLQYHWWRQTGVNTGEGNVWLRFHRGDTSPLLTPSLWRQVDEETSQFILLSRHLTRGVCAVYGTTRLASHCYCVTVLHCIYMFRMLDSTTATCSWITYMYMWFGGIHTCTCSCSAQSWQCLLK